MPARRSCYSTNGIFRCKQSAEYQSLFQHELQASVADSSDCLPWLQIAHGCLQHPRLEPDSIRELCQQLYRARLLELVCSCSARVILGEANVHAKSLFGVLSELFDHREPSVSELTAVITSVRRVVDAADSAPNDVATLIAVRSHMTLLTVMFKADAPGTVDAPSCTMINLLSSVPPRTLAPLLLVLMDALSIWIERWRRKSFRRHKADSEGVLGRAAVLFHGCMLSVSLVGGADAASATRRLVTSALKHGIDDDSTMSIVVNCIWYQYNGNGTASAQHDWIGLDVVHEMLTSHSQFVEIMCRRPRPTCAT